ncbi:MAG TPA: ferrochelatase [Flavitalea sp.]|nr:ferrochelatase [Flavitalea sp.]
MAKGIKRGILLMNLGSPDSTEVKDVKRYLDQFLMDERVIDKPYLLRTLLVKGIITPSRAPKSAEAYKTIWTKEGSPLIVLSKQLQQAVQLQVEEPVELLMRYGNPDPQTAFGNLVSREPALDEVLAIPLYPHYAMSSFETAVEYAKDYHRKKNYPFRLKFLKPYFNHPDYIAALADRMRPYLAGEFDHLLFSYHGVPGRHIRKSDITGRHCLASPNCCSMPSPAHDRCYRHQCFTTTRLITEALNIPKEKHSISFQSRLGKGWLEPFTDIRLEEMPAEGIKKLLVICPAFVSDCLETLEEIAERGKESFMKAGGETYEMIPCLNTHPKWVKALSGWIEAYRNGNEDLIMHQ